VIELRITEDQARALVWVLANAVSATVSADLDLERVYKVLSSHTHYVEVDGASVGNLIVRSGPGVKARLVKSVPSVQLDATI
jgi:hypothetical protein